MKRALLLLLAACASDGPIDLSIGDAPVRVTVDVDGSRWVRLEASGLVEAWVDGGEIALADERAPQWLPPQARSDFNITGDGEVTLTVWPRGAIAPPSVRSRSLAWLEPAVLDDPSIVSFARVMATISDDGHGGALLARWFRAFAAGPGAGRAAFAQFLDEIETQQGPDPAAWELAALPFRVTGVHDRFDLARGADCGELRVSIASTHPAFAPLHFLFLFRQLPADDDITPDGAIHCRGTALRWARLAAVDEAQWPATARALLDEALVRDRFVMAESVELTISPWQWRQWVPDGSGGLANPPLFQTVDVARVNAPGAVRDDFLAEVSANAGAIAAREWAIPSRFRSAAIDAQPNAKAALVDLSSLAVPADLPRALGLVGCPRCHTDNADFIQTSVDRVPSPFYDRELDARAATLDALARGEWPAIPSFGPLQPL